MSKHCMITFDQNEHGTYFTGQIVTGKVIINLNKSKKLRGIKLEITGYASAQWKTNAFGRHRANPHVRRRNRRLYSGHEDYFVSTTYLMGSAHGQNFTVDGGTYTYNFACPIPSNCPTSFEGTYGHIRYLAKVSFIRCGAANRTHNVGFTVLKLLDLNAENKLLREPASNEALEYFCLMQSKPVQLKVTLQQQGYVPGQFMLVHAHIRNDSSSDCKRLLIMLHLRATYTADTPSLRTVSEKIMLLKKECGSVPHHAQKAYTETLRIPATAPTCEHLSKVLRVSYEVRVVAVMDWMMPNPRVVIPITIGNVPLATVASMASTISGGNVGSVAPPPLDMPTTSTRAMALAASGSGFNNDAFESSDDLDDYAIPDDGDDEFETEEEFVPDLPPPTYEQAMFMTADIADTDANTVSEASRFTPRYPVFDVDTFQGPPPNPPQKRRRRRRRKAPQNGNDMKERPPVESPIQI